MARYRFLAVDLVTGTIRDEVPIDTLTFGDTLNRATDFSAELPSRHPKVTRANIDPARTLIVVERDGAIVGGGIVWDPKVTPGRLSVKGGSIGSYFYRRTIRETRTYTQVDEGTIVADLIAWAQGAGSLTYGVTAGDPTGDVRVDTSTAGTTGTLRDRTYHSDERTVIGDAIENLTGVIGGPDVWFRIAYDADGVVPYLHVAPRRGTRIAEPFELGTGVMSYDVVDMGSRTETHVDAVGQGQGDSMLIVSAADPSAHPAYPRLDGVASHKDVSRVDTLTGHAQARLQDRRRPPRLVTVTVDPDRLPRFGAWQTGDEARVIVDDGYAQVDRLLRIARWTMTVNRDGAEALSVTFAGIED